MNALQIKNTVEKYFQPYLSPDKKLSNEYQFTLFKPSSSPQFVHSLLRKKFDPFQLNYVRFSIEETSRNQLKVTVLYEHALNKKRPGVNYCESDLKYGFQTGGPAQRTPEWYADRYKNYITGSNLFNIFRKNKYGKEENTGGLTIEDWNYEEYFKFCVGLAGRSSVEVTGHLKSSHMYRGIHGENMVSVLWESNNPGKHWLQLPSIQDSTYPYLWVSADGMHGGIAGEIKMPCYVNEEHCERITHVGDDMYLCARVPRFVGKYADIDIFLEKYHEEYNAGMIHWTCPDCKLKCQTIYVDQIQGECSVLQAPSCTFLQLRTLSIFEELMGMPQGIYGTDQTIYPKKVSEFCEKAKSKPEWLKKHPYTDWVFELDVPADPMWLANSIPKMEEFRMRVENYRHENNITYDKWVDRVTKLSK
jgi:hypothetical protein